VETGYYVELTEIEDELFTINLAREHIDVDVPLTNVLWRWCAVMIYIPVLR
jgi:hypothetical protein